MFYQNFGKNHGDPYYEPTIVVHNTNNHWCNEVMMHQYITKIILPYIRSKRKEFKLSDDHPAVLTFNNFKEQRTSQFLTQTTYCKCDPSATKLYRQASATQLECKHSY